MKIYDGFQFFNELELLDIRFNELYDAVDKFIIVESTKTHQNKPKPLYFWENKDKFSPFLDKVIHHIFDPKEYPHTWYIENEQRNQLKYADFSMQKEDIFLLSDADEFLKKESISYIRENAKIFQNSPHTAVMQMSYNYINTVVVKPQDVSGWRGTVILPYDYYNQYNLQFFRDKKDFLPRFENAGWHLSFIGGPERIKSKIESYAHSEYNLEQLKEIKNIENRINSLQDPLSRNSIEIELENDLLKFPQSSLKFKELFYANS
jgi:beta-1,4-mannosyl-glycoprotein beta-1,4-N-acetylglucosaminyltransferase